MPHRGADTEAALDRGTVTAGPREAVICELELEHRSGPVEVLFDWPWRLVAQHAVEGRARRALARGEPATAVKAEPVDMPAHANGATMLLAVLRNTLAQVLPTASEVAEGSDDAEIIHQLRVGLRRLRTALRESSCRPVLHAIAQRWHASHAAVTLIR